MAKKCWGNQGLRLEAHPPRGKGVLDVHWHTGSRVSEATPEVNLQENFRCPRIQQWLQPHLCLDHDQ